MFGQLDLLKEKPDIKLYLAKPNKNIIASLTEAHNITPNISMSEVNDIGFDIPYSVTKRGEPIANKNIDKIKFKYLIKAVIDEVLEEWFVIEDFNKDMNDNEDSMHVSAYSLGFELSYKFLSNYKGTSENLKQVATNGLNGTNWNVGHVDGEFSEKYRGVEQSSTTVLDFMYTIAETFDATIVWDTINRKVNFYHINNIGENKGLKFKYGKYLKSLRDSISGRDFCTRLKISGKDGLSIQEINPSGTNYIEDFSYFMRGFERDGDGNTISSSEYMSDELCHAILDYQMLIESKRGVYTEYIKELDEYLSALSEKEIEKFNYQTVLSQSIDRMDIQENSGDYHKLDLDLPSGNNHYSELTSSYGAKQIMLIKTSVDSTITFGDSDSESTETINFQGSDNWKMYAIPESVYVEHGFSERTLSVDVGNNSSDSGNLNILILRVLSDELDENHPIEYYLSRYNYDYNQKIMDDLDEVISDIEVDMELVHQDIEELQSEISIENNFSQELIQERNQYIIEKTWQDQNLFEVEEILSEGIKKLSEMSKPPTVIDIDIINFLEVVEAQRDWNKLKLGDFVTIEYDKFNLLVQARITTINYNFESYSISLTISDIKKPDELKDKMKNILSQGVSTSSQVTNSKSKWDNSEENAKKYSDQTIQRNSGSLRSYTDLKAELSQYKAEGHTNAIRARLESEIDDAHDRISLAEDDISIAMEEIETAKIGISDLEGSLDSANGRIDDTMISIDNNYKLIQDASGDIDSALTRIGENEQSVFNANGRIDAANQNISNLEQGLLDANGEIDTAKERLDTAENNISEGFNNVNNAIDDLERNKITITDAENEIQNTISNPQDYVGNFDGDIAADNMTLRNRLTAQNATIAGTLNGDELTFNSGTFEDITAIRATIQDATITGQLDGNEATILDLTTERMNAVDATIQDAIITGTLGADEATFVNATMNNLTAIGGTFEDIIITGDLQGNNATILDLTTRNMTAINATIQDATISGNLNALDATFADATMSKATIVEGTMRDTTITGTLEGNNATILDLTTQRMTAIDATIQDATITGQLDSANATFLNATVENLTAIGGVFEDVYITGELNGATGSFSGDITGANGRFDGSISASNLTSGGINADEITISNDKVRIDNNGVTVRDADFLMEDSVTGLKSLATSRRNYLQDASFDFVGVDFENNRQGVGVFDAVGGQSMVSGWVAQGLPRIITSYLSDAPEDSAVFGMKSILVSGNNWVEQAFFTGAEHNEYTISVHYARHVEYLTGGHPQIEIEYWTDTYDVISSDVISLPEPTVDGQVYRDARTVSPPSNTRIMVVKLKTQNSRWIIYDGIQITAGDLPSPFIPESELSYFTHGLNTAEEIRTRYLDVSMDSHFHDSVFMNDMIHITNENATAMEITRTGNFSGVWLMDLGWGGFGFRNNDNHGFLMDEDGNFGVGKNIRSSAYPAHFYINSTHVANGTVMQIDNGNGEDVLNVDGYGNLKIRSIDSNGRWNHLYIRPESGSRVRATEIGTTTTYAPVQASDFITTSLEDHKTDIELSRRDALNIISETDIYDYYLKSEIENGTESRKTGVIIGRKTPKEIMNNDKEGIEQYTMVSLSWKAIKELLERVEYLEGKVAKM